MGALDCGWLVFANQAFGLESVDEHGGIIFEKSNVEKLFGSRSHWYAALSEVKMGCL